MSKLPESIILVVIKHTNKNSHLRKICREFFKGMPHIVYTDYNLNSNNTYFVFPNMEIIHSFIYQLYDDGANMSMPNILAYGTYTYEQTLSLVLNTYSMSWSGYVINTQWLPPTVKIDPNDVKKLESLSED